MMSRTLQRNSALASIGRVPSKLTESCVSRSCADGDVAPVMVIGTPTRCPPEHVLEAAVKAAKDNERSPSQGFPSFRRAISKKLQFENGITVDPDREVVVTYGAMHGLYLTLLTLVNPGDYVILHKPNFFFDGILRLVCASPIFIETSAETNFAWSVPDLQKTLDKYPKARVLLLNTPQNPTGYVASDKTLLEVARLANHYGLTVIMDESYEKLVFDGAKHHSLGAGSYGVERIVTVHSFTKAYSMPGWRIGFIAGDSNIIGDIHKVLEWMVLHISAVTQRAAEAALEGTDAMVDSITQQFAWNRDHLLDVLGGVAGTRCYRPAGGPFLFPEVDIPGYSADSLATELQKAGLYVDPGAAFGAPNRLRIPFGGEAEEARLFGERLARVLSRTAHEPMKREATKGRG